MYKMYNINSINIAQAGGRPIIIEQGRSDGPEERMESGGHRRDHPLGERRDIGCDGNE